MQHLFSSIPPPAFTPESLIDLSTKVYIITSRAPSSLHLAKILYALHATIYLGFDSNTNFQAVVDDIKVATPGSKGSLKLFLFDPRDSSSVKTAVERVVEQEWRLDILFLNTQDGVLLVLFTLANLLLPLLHATASHFCHPNPSIRVVWIAPSSMPNTDSGSTHPGAADTMYLLAHAFTTLPPPSPKLATSANAHNLPTSNPSGVQHVCVTTNPEYPKWQRFVKYLVPVSPKDEVEKAACTLLYAGLAPDVRSGDWVAPWGRRAVVPEHLQACTMEKHGKETSSSAQVYARYVVMMRQFMGGQNATC
ncbi:hypothetical protein EK21DRAFT_65133 [Setomelanomma holmii]|uniref:Uncharacterized protein n=1 Tax=Setomelanomma holmii TaxID=210430 RepID=A0A9P4HAV0_9PLEO|nr:hypothetical protein EK21DRAFT_65133 [Setomelanomma holmii]